ncbi:YhcH/YjgK/YiaL family protein [Poriferisphaera sp. WC338]|uniref:YhcH/YjgK/YiaL family protein n=1 Tax=Poriferisphaera sp. WC338 TaxID=3425129 RepID=UPI003D81AC65
MIYDHIDNISLYKNLPANLTAGLQFLKNVNPTTLKPGRNDLQGEGPHAPLFANFDSYTSRTTTESKYESHRRYIDIQYIISGNERIAISPTPTSESNTGQPLAVTDSYNDEKDFELYDHNPDILAGTQWVILRPNHFVILYPHEAHMPCIQFDGPTEIQKIVVKAHI